MNKEILKELKSTNQAVLNDPIIYFFSKNLKSSLAQHLTAVSLFGSRARGDERDHSDYDFLVIVDKKDKYIKSVILNVETLENELKDISFNFIELPKFNKDLNECLTLADKWIYFIKNAENLDVIPPDVTDGGLKEAYTESDKHNWTKDELASYDYYLMREQDERGRIELAERRVEEKVEKKSREKAEKEKLEIAKKFKLAGVAFEIISSSTGLSIEIIEKL